MTGNTSYDTRQIFRHACAFADCACFCEKEPSSIVNPTQWYTIPDIVNSAFACEVFLKSLLVYHGLTIDEIKGHEIIFLWNKLQEKDETIATNIQTSIQELFNCDDDLFDEMITNISNAFQYWRYIYEKFGGKIHINFLRAFRETLRNACCQKFYNQTWSEYTAKKE